MLKARKVASCLLVAGIALLVQGCWEEQDQLTLIGEGGCRTADGGHGESLTISGGSLDQCKANCLVANGQCVALEYDGKNSKCELHSKPIAYFEEIVGVSCYRRE